jgi:hypothetical protein
MNGVPAGCSPLVQDMWASKFWPVPIVFHNLQIDSSYLDRVRISKLGTIFYLLRSLDSNRFTYGGGLGQAAQKDCPARPQPMKAPEA